MDDEILQSFVEESNEHLAQIEANLLAIEERGVDVDEVLVNQVFRAAHSIKGGSGFFGLTRIKELAHKTETILDLIRSRQLVPNAEVVGLLLSSFDRLRSMVNESKTSENVEIADLVEGLTALASSYLPGNQKDALRQSVRLGSQGEVPSVSLPKVDFERTLRSAQFIYAVEYDLIHDIERRGRTVLELFRDLEKNGEILDCTVDFEAVGGLDAPLGKTLPLRLVFATAKKPQAAISLLGVPRERVRRLLHLPAADGATLAASVPAPAQEREPLAPAEAPQKVKSEGVPEEPPSPPEKVPSPSTAGPATTTGAAAVHTAQEGTLRVSVGLLDTLMNLAGELVLSRNQLRAAISRRDQQSLSDAEQRLDQVTANLQNVIMETRLQPVGNLFGKFQRVVRDLSRSLKKDIRLDIEGRDVALDRSIIEGLSDPLTHMVRNAVDHGIETPEERTLAGKSPQGVVGITARHEAGQVVVEVTDDGKGIDLRRVAAAALKKGLVTEERLARMSEQDRAALILLPGLSTASAVTDLSGRGVGMDVVKTNLDRLGGKVDIQTQLGKGTVFRIKLPLTLAIIPSLIVSIEGERFAIPQINIEELLRIQPGERKNRIGVVGGVEVLLLRDRMLPLISLASPSDVTRTYTDSRTGVRELDRRTRLADRRSPRFGATEEVDLSGSSTAEKDRRASEDRRQRNASVLEVAVVTTGTMSFGLVVDAFHDSEEIVVKPLGRHLKPLKEYAGATILGDGRVALILDAAGLAAKADLISRARPENARIHGPAAEGTEQSQFLLFHNSPGEVCGVPLDLVERIERITPDQLQGAAGRRTIQYRGASLPLLALSDVAQVKPVSEDLDLVAIVSRIRGREIGLLGARPVDVVEASVLLDGVTHRQPGIAGSAIVRDQTILITDLLEIVDSVYPEWGKAEAASSTPMPGGGRACVLLADDSDFFRGQVRRYLEEDAYTVLEAPDGEAAWEMLLSHQEEIQMVVTDVEMPRLSGLGLAQRIRSDPRTAALPVIALSSLAGEEDLARGREAGASEYLIKLDRDRLLAAVRDQLATLTSTGAKGARPSHASLT